MLNHARTAVSVFAFLLAVLLAVAAREMFGEAAALFALTLFVFDPLLVAHGPLLGTDVGAACCVGEAALLIDVIAPGLPTNQPDEFAGRWAQKSGPVLGTGFWDWPRYAFAILSGQSFETLEASILGPSDFAPKLTSFETFDNLHFFPQPETKGCRLGGGLR
jgi:hypothetical protein